MPEPAPEATEKLDNSIDVRSASPGKPFKVIVVARMRKLPTILNIMIRQNRSWNPRPVLRKRLTSNTAAYLLPYLIPTK